MVLGALALFILLILTTPLKIHAASCYAKSSERFHLWLVGSPLQGSYIHSFRDHMPLRLSTTLATIALVWMAMLAMMPFIINDPMIRQALLGVAIAKTIPCPCRTGTLREMPRNGGYRTPNRHRKAPADSRTPLPSGACPYPRPRPSALPSLSRR